MKVHKAHLTFPNLRGPNRVALIDNLRRSCGAATLLVTWFVSLLATAYAQTPSLLWATNVGAQVFAIDSQTNVYANAGGTVIEVNAEGAVLQTNSVCPVPGFAQRDAKGNFYFAGTLPPPPFPYGPVTPVDFGGVILSNGPMFIVKYQASGALLWAKEFGPSSAQTGGRWATATDFCTTTNGDSYVGFLYWNSTTGFYSELARFESGGSNAWISNVPNLSQAYTTINGSLRLGLTAEEGGFSTLFMPTLTYATTFLSESGYRFGLDGAVSNLFNVSFTGGSASRYARPSSDSSHNVYNVETELLTKRDPIGNILWSTSVGKQWTVAADQFDGVHIAGDSGSLSRYDLGGGLAWTLFLVSPVNSMVLDAQGNRFISLVDGTLARLGAETLSAPRIAVAPASLTSLAGSNVLLSVAATGFGPLHYYWRQNDTPFTGGKNANLVLTNVTTNQAGLYTVVVSNLVGSITSSPALLRVKQVALFHGDHLLTNGTYYFSTRPTLTIRSSFTNGSFFYSLDGSAPTFNSIHYNSSVGIQILKSASVQAIGYTGDFLQSEEADTINAIVPAHILLADTVGGGTVMLDPPGGVYDETNVVTVTAVPTVGWSFLYWLGDASGTDPSIQLSMLTDKAVEAVFGTTISTSVEGSGNIKLYPTGPSYPYGTVVQLTGVPQPGSYFGFWGEGATGNTSPIYLTITNPWPAVSSVFGNLSGGQASLAVLNSGPGRVLVYPITNQFAAGAMVTLTGMALR
jgi:hypothetical protein